jgi:hypothetical protein
VPEAKEKEAAASTDGTGDVVTVGTPPTKWEIVTTAQVERTYHVVADTAELAHARLRQWLKDRDGMRPELVTLLAKEHDATPQKVKGDIKRHKEV